MTENFGSFQLKVSASVLLQNMRAKYFMSASQCYMSCHRNLAHKILKNISTWNYNLLSSFLFAKTFQGGWRTSLFTLMCTSCGRNRYGQTDSNLN